MISSPAGISSEGRADLTTVLGMRQRFVTTDDVVTALDVDAQSASRKLSRWAAEGWLRRVRRNLYIPVPVDASNPTTWSEDEMIVASALWPESYLSGWTSANYWALTDQLFRTTVVKTAGRVRASSLRFLDHDYLLSHAIPDSLRWGMRSEWKDEVRIRIADPARTVIDILDNPRLGGGIRHCVDITSTYLEEHDSSLLINYGERLGNLTVFKRLGYIAEFLESDDALVNECLSRISTGVSQLDPEGSPHGRTMTRWQLQINVALARKEPS